MAGRKRCQAAAAAATHRKAKAIGSGGQVPRLVRQVGHVSFSGPRARAQGQEVICVTERAVFQLRPDGIELIEVADEVEVQRDVVERMGFKPIVGEVKRMPLE